MVSKKLGSLQKVEKLRDSQGMAKKDYSIMVFKVIESFTHQFELMYFVD